MNTERLRRDHAAILRSASQLSGLAGKVRTRDDSLDARSVIDVMDAGLVAHLAHEDIEVYPWLMGHPDAVLQRLARDAFADLGMIKGAWSSYRDTWTPDRILADTDRFATATDAIVQALAIRITMENQVLYPAVETAATGQG